MNNDRAEVDELIIEIADYKNYLNWYNVAPTVTATNTAITAYAARMVLKTNVRSFQNS